MSEPEFVAIVPADGEYGTTRHFNLLRVGAWLYDCGADRVVAHDGWSRGASTQWCKGRAVARGVDLALEDYASDTIALMCDGDVMIDKGALRLAIGAVDAGAPYAIPHTMVRRLSDENSQRVIDGAVPNEDMHTYEVHKATPGGGIVVSRLRTMARVPIDPRFVGWGQEDKAWHLALRTIVGQPWTPEVRTDLYHLWHIPQQRLTRAVGSTDGHDLWKRYASADGNVREMIKIISEFGARP